MWHAPSFPNTAENQSCVMPHILPHILPCLLHPSNPSVTPTGLGAKRDGICYSAKSTDGNLKQQHSYLGRRNLVLWIRRLWKLTADRLGWGRGPCGGFWSVQPVYTTWTHLEIIKPLCSLSLVFVLNSGPPNCAKLCVVQLALPWEH